MKFLKIFVTILKIAGIHKMFANFWKLKFYKTDHVFFYLFQDIKFCFPEFQKMFVNQRNVHKFQKMFMNLKNCLQNLKILKNLK